MGRPISAFPLPCLLVLLAGCAAGGPGAPVPAASAGDPWSGLATPRPQPLAGAARVAVGEISAPSTWEGTSAVPASVGLQELVAAGLVRRADVEYVERRRFNARLELERSGATLPAGAPPLGTTPGAELVLLGSALELSDTTWLDLRLVDPATSETRSAWRVAVPARDDPAGVARAVVGSLMGALAGLGRRPSWTDPLPDAATARFAPSEVGLSAWRAFLSGVAQEDRYDWDAARSAYQRALQLGGPSFFEAEVALSRTARLRAGGSLGAG